MRKLRAWTALTGALLICGSAAAEKPPALPPGAGAAPDAGARLAPPQPGADKFGLPLPGRPPVAGGPQADQFAAPLVVPTPPPAATAPIPANEPDAVAVLRSLLGPDTTLRYAEADTIDPARGAARLRDVVAERAGERAEIAELTLEGLTPDGVTEFAARGVTVRQGSEITRIDRVRIAGLAVARGAPDQPLNPGMVSLDLARIEGLSTQGATPVAIAAAAIEGYGSGRAGRASLEGLVVELGPQGGAIDRVALGRLALRGVDMAALASAMVERSRPPSATGASALEAEDLVLGQSGRQIAALASLSLTGEAPTAGGAGTETARLALRDISVLPFPAIGDWMRRFGYTALHGDLTAEIRIDRAAGRMEIAGLSLAARDIGALGLSFALDRLRFLADGPEVVENGRLASLRLRYVDQSLYGRFVRQQAQQMRRTEQQVRNMFAEQARAVFEPPAGGGPKRDGPGGSASAEIGAALQRFLRGQAREIELAAQPPAPVPLLDLQGLAMGGPDVVQRALRLTVTAR
jgi:hypothetical protein